MYLKTIKIGVIDAGIGTFRSVANMLNLLDVPSKVLVNPSEIKECSHLVFPGVGNFQRAARQISDGDWAQPINAFAQKGGPLLGICLGMQLLGLGSEEGPGAGLGLLNFKSFKLAPGLLRVPKIGWDTIEPKVDHKLFSNWDEQARFYFVHSYAVPASGDFVVGVSKHNETFASIVAEENVMGVQFHPEKSSRFGMKLLENFVAID